jgi:hypothetical protein
MKLKISFKILILFFFALYSSQLRSNDILIYGNKNVAEYTLDKPIQSDEELVITAISEIETYPEFKGVNKLLNQLKKNVESALRGSKPYRVKTNEENGTVSAARQGNALVLEVILIPCEEERRHYFFDAASLIYSSINPKEESVVHSKVRTAVMDKATSSFAGAQIQEPYPNHINLVGFSGLNTLEPTKEYILILKFLVGKKVGGYYDLGDNLDETNKSDDVSNKLIQYKSLAKIYLPNNQPTRILEGGANILNQSSYKNNKSVSVKGTSEKKSPLNIKNKKQVQNKKLFDVSCGWCGRNFIMTYEPPSRIFCSIKCQEENRFYQENKRYIKN